MTCGLSFFGVNILFNKATVFKKMKFVLALPIVPVHIRHFWCHVVSPLRFTTSAPCSGHYSGPLEWAGMAQLFLSTALPTGSALY